jgi:hypothetical protein
VQVEVLDEGRLEPGVAEGDVLEDDVAAELAALRGLVGVVRGLEGDVDGDTP